MPRFSIIVPLILALVGASGCGAKRTAAWETTAAKKAVAPETSGATPSATDAAEAAWAERDQEPKVREAIAAWKAKVDAEPSDHETWTKLARAYYFLADGHVRFHEGEEEEVEREMLATFEDSITAAEHALIALSEPFAGKMRNGDNIEDAAQVLGPEAVPALYWRSSSLGKWASAKGFATLLSHKDEIREIMQLCLDKAPNYNHQAPDRYFGVFYARAPSFAGGDTDKSRAHFGKSLQAAPDYFATRVLMAQDLAVKVQDRQLFEKQLNYVLSTDPDTLPGAAPENRVEQKKAKQLLSKADELFE